LEANLMATRDDVPAELATLIAQADQMSRAFLSGLSFIVRDTARDPSYFDRHLLSYTAEDYLQSVAALPLLIQEGIHNICRRELRFVLEMSIKLCFIQQKQYSSDIATKLATFKKELDSTNISVQKQLDLHLLPAAEHAAFYQEVGRLYGESSGYVHLTHAQIIERIALVNQGRTSGKEGPAQIVSLNRLVARGLACSLVFLLHSVPDYVAGDLLVQPDGSSIGWPFAESRYAAFIDEHFDYKAERQAALEEIKRQRWARVAY
jgi:hypothetical protein